ncbi:type B 50S ribosomal protein L31 [Kitasatospora indigofera]|uniref:type B 50S ribosomal protein L31 n=1 Tax=Kitasatospora indigofera TaxID=67307 RepID=UPI0036D103C0
MQTGIHPAYRPVVFRDRSGDLAFLTRSTIGTGTGTDTGTGRTVEWEDGHSYPVVDVEVSSASHPFHTGRARVLDSAGRIEAFHRRYGKQRG